MAFLHPSFLWALTALAIPILIHLFQLRRFKRIEFSDVRFLQQVTQQTRARKKVRHWLTLIARMLAIAALVFAFAQPYLPNTSGKVTAGQRDVSLYIDDSWSMDGQNAQGRLLDQARSDAQDAVMAYSATDRFQVLTNRFEGRQQLLLGRDEALEAAARAEVGSFARPLGQVMERQREALARGEGPVKRAFLFTDLQRSTTDVDAWRNDSAVSTVIVPLPAGDASNLAIDSVWFASPVRRLGQVEDLHVRVRNFGDQQLENIPLRLSIDGRQRALASFGVAPRSQVDTVLHFTNDATGAHYGEVSLTDRPIVFDDVFHIAYRTASSLRVLLVSGGDAASDRDVKAVFAGDSTHTFSEQPYRQLDLASLSRTDLVILNALPDVPSGLADALKSFADEGGSVALFPAADADAASYSALLQRFGAAFGMRDTASTKVDRIDLALPFYSEVFTTMPRNVDLPTVRLRFAFKAPPTANKLLQLNNGTGFLSDIPTGSGRFYLGTSPLSEQGGNFTRHALFVTSLLRMAELSRPMGALYHIIGDGTAIPLEGVALPGEAAPHLRGPEGADIVPEVRRTLNTVSLALHDAELLPGPYAVTLGADTIATIALDLPRTESDLAAYTPEQLREELEQRGLATITVLDKAEGGIAVSLRELDQGTKLWKWFVIAALVFLALEILFIRLSK
ncbi:MAG TPA: BatA domain-containing protein [Flavobacteriales bacterium]